MTNYILRGDGSILVGIQTSMNNHKGHYTFSIFDSVQDMLSDPVTSLAEFTFHFISDWYGVKTFSSAQGLLLDAYLLNLCKEGHDCARFRLGAISSTNEFRWSRQALSDLLSLLVEIGASVPIRKGNGEYFLDVMAHDVENRASWALEDLIFALIQVGDNIHDVHNDGERTCSVLARYHGVWPIWCRALHDSGNEIEGVLREEGNEWLLEDDWEMRYLQRFRHLHSIREGGDLLGSNESQKKVSDPEATNDVEVLIKPVE